MKPLVHLKLQHCVALNEPGSVNVCWEVNTQIKLRSARSVFFFLSLFACALLG